MTIRIGNLEDFLLLKALVKETIKNICSSDYNEKQIKAWLSKIDDKKRWKNVLMNQFVIISLDNGTITGLCTLNKGYYIDLLFVHKDYQQQGIANKLYTEIEKEARRQEVELLSVDASKTARLFFEKKGFIVLKEQEVNIEGVNLTNYKMSKNLKSNQIL